MKKRLVALATVIVTALIGATPSAAADDYYPPLEYRAHSQSVGWGAWVPEGAQAGTIGKRMEAFSFNYGLDIEARAHVQGLGWREWMGPGSVIGTTGQSLRLEAFQMVSYDPRWQVQYRAYVEGKGWQGWKRNSATAGTTGQGLAIQAIKIRIYDTQTGAKFAVTADNGLDSNAQAVFDGIEAGSADFGFVLGDLAYEPDAEQAYCDMVNSRTSIPIALLGGNHEDDPTHDGYLRNYLACMPDPLGVTGTYGKDYYVDRDAARFIMISPTLLFDGVQKDYLSGSVEREWLKAAVREAQAAGKWVVVGMHKPCLTLGSHGCEPGPNVTDLLMGLKVDLVVEGHDHNYIRSNQLSGTVAAPSVVDNDSDFAQGAGTVFAIVGNGGHNPRTVAPLTSLWAKASGTNSPGGITFGFGRVTADEHLLEFSLKRTGGGSLTDTFTISR